MCFFRVGVATLRRVGEPASPRLYYYSRSGSPGLVYSCVGPPPSRLCAGHCRIDAPLAELSVAEPDFIGVQLGTRTLAGARGSEGFEASGEELVPPANPDGTGIFVTLDAPEASLRAFSGELVYDLVSSRGHCTLVFDAVGEWMYYEPPPPCTG